MKKHKSMIVLGAVLVLLVAAYVGLGKYQSAQDEKQEKEAESAKVYVTNLTGIAGISYTDGSSSFSFTKTDNSWGYDEDASFPLDETYVTYMESALSKIEAVRVIKESDAMSAYGLENPAYTVTLTDKGGEKTNIYIGNATGDNYYLTLDQKTVYTVASTITDSLVWDLNSMVLLDTFPSISSGNLVSVDIARDGTTTTYTEDDEEAIANCAGGLGAVDTTSMAAYDIKDDTAQAAYGLDSGNRMTIVVKYTDENEESQTLTLYIGNKDSAGENYYMQIEGSGIVYNENVNTINSILNQ